MESASSQYLSGAQSGAQYGMSRLLQETFDVREGTAGSILQRLLNAARLHLGMEVAFISEFEGGYRTFRYVDQAEGLQLVAVGSGAPLDQTYCQKVVDGRLPELIHNAQELNQTRAIPATEDLGIGAHLSVPIRLQDGSVFGTFCGFCFQSDYTLNDRDLALMRVIADIAADLIQKDIDQARDEEAENQRIEGLMDREELTMV